MSKMQGTKTPDILSATQGTIWAIVPEKLDALLESLGWIVPGTEYEARTSEDEPRIEPGSVAVLTISGIITHKPSWISLLFGGNSTIELGEVLDNLVENKAVKAIVLDVDSPGGSVSGVQELSQKIFDARSKKPIIAVANSLMASAAYWIGSAAEKVYIIPSGQVGSVGVYAVHVDTSVADERAGYKYTIIDAGKHKTELTETEPLSDEARGYLQHQIDSYYKKFISDVARNRGVSPSKVLQDYGQGRVLVAEDAAGVGMVDGIATLDEVINITQKEIPKTKTRSWATAACEVAELQFQTSPQDENERIQNLDTSTTTNE